LPRSRVEVGNDRHRDRLNGAGPNALNEPKDDHRHHRSGKTGEDGSAEEDGDTHEHHGLSTIDIGKLSEDHGHRGLRQQER
jgi:hypothetical protein